MGSGVPLARRPGHRVSGVRWRKHHACALRGDTGYRCVLARRSLSADSQGSHGCCSAARRSSVASHSSRCVGQLSATPNRRFRVSPASERRIEPPEWPCVDGLSSPDEARSGPRCQRREPLERSARPDAGCNDPGRIVCRISTGARRARLRSAGGGRRRLRARERLTQSHGGPRAITRLTTDGGPSWLVR